MLSIALIVYTPSIFTKALNIGLELLPDYKFISYHIEKKSALAQYMRIDSPSSDDEAFFQQIKLGVPNSKDKNSFFFRMFSVHDYPRPCLFTIFGMHRTMDVTWRIEGVQCKNRENCLEAQTQQICPDKKDKKRENR